MPCFQHTEEAVSGNTLGSYWTLLGANITCAASNIQIVALSLKIHFHLPHNFIVAKRDYNIIVKDKNTI